MVLLLNCSEKCTRSIIMSIIFSGRKNLELTKVEGADVNKRVMSLILTAKLFQMESMVNRLACKLATFLI